MEPADKPKFDLDKLVRTRYQERLDSWVGATRPHRHLFREFENEPFTHENGIKAHGLFNDWSLHINWKRIINREKGDYDTFVEMLYQYIETFTWNARGNLYKQSATQVAGAVHNHLERFTGYLNYLTKKNTADGKGIQLVFNEKENKYVSGYVESTAPVIELDEGEQEPVVKELTEHEKGAAESDELWMEAGNEVLEPPAFFSLIEAKANKASKE